MAVVSMSLWLSRHGDYAKIWKRAEGTACAEALSWKKLGMFKTHMEGNSLVVQWLGLGLSGYFLLNWGGKGYWASPSC